MLSDFAIGLMIIGSMGGLFAILGFLANYLARRDYRKRYGRK